MPDNTTLMNNVTIKLKRKLNNGGRIMSTILVTGGAGYIGSHTCVELLENNKEVVVLDNLSNSSEEALNRVKRITGKEVKFYKGDISDIVILDTIFKKEILNHVFILQD